MSIGKKIKHKLISSSFSLPKINIFLFYSWAEQNVDPSLFPKELMINVSYLIGDEEVEFSYMNQ